MDKSRKIDLTTKQQINLMTDLSQFFNFSRTPNGTYQQQNLGGHAGGGPQQASFDINEFPSLSKMSLLSQMQASSRANYVNIAKENATQLNQSSSVDQAQSEFTISSEDFPALPGSNNPNVSIIGTKSTTNNNAGTNNSSSSSSSIGPMNTNNSELMNGACDDMVPATAPTLSCDDMVATAAIDQCAREKSYSFPLVPTPSVNVGKGVQISNDGRVTNIPSSMVTDQFGMIGLLAFLRAAETDPNLASVTFGTDLTALGLNLTASEKLYSSFAGPWTDQPLKVYEIDYPVPQEYSVNSSIRDKLTQITLKRYHEDTIFFLFYMFPNDMLQILAAIELYSREWRYHKEEKVWITRAPGIAPSEKTNSYERGTYYIFDALLWRRVPREFVLEYDRLESKPKI